MFPYLDLGFFKLPMYGLMLLVGFLSGLWLARHRAAQYGVPKETLLDLATYIILAGLAGARLLYVLLHLEYFWRHPHRIIFNRSDFVFFGGAVAATVVVYLFCRARSLSLWDVTDCFAPGAALGHAFGRVGCFLQGCCYGARCDLPWAVRFPSNLDPSGRETTFANPAFADHVDHFGLPADAPFSFPVHPTQLYESAANLLIAAVLIWLSRRQRFRGQIIVTYIALYSLARFTIEHFRGDLERGVFGPFSTSQWIAAVTFVAALVLWRVRRADTIRPPEQVPDEHVCPHLR